MNTKEKSMTRVGSLFFCAALAVSGALVSCGGGDNGGAGGSGVGGAGTGGGGGGTGGTPKNPLDLVPQDNDVSGWTVDQEHSKTPGSRAMTASNELEAVGLIDGGAAPFYLAPFSPKEFLWQNYVNDTLAAAPTGAWVMLYILAMPSSEQASGLYASLLKQSDYSRKAGTSEDWQPTSPLLGAESRIQDTNSSWWINFHQGVYYVEVQLGPSSGPPPDYTRSDPDLKQECFRFAQAIALGI
jgi:hypothetical protein